MVSREEYLRYGKKAASFFLSQEGGSLLLGSLISLLFFMLTFNRGVYLTLYAAAFWGMYLLYVHRRQIDWAFALKTASLPLLFCFYVMVTPGAFFKDMPLGEVMILSYLLGLSGAIFWRSSFICVTGSLLLGFMIGLLIFLFRGFPSDMVWNGRLALFFDHPAVLAFIAGFAFLYFVDNSTRYTSKIKYLSWVGAVICLGIVAFCASRGTYLALLVGSFFLLFFAFRRYVLPALGILIVGMALLFAALPEWSQQRVLAAVEHPFQDPTFISRQPIWEAAASGFEASPWWGNGLRSFRVYHERFVAENAQVLRAKYPVVEKSMASPHNSFLGFLFAYGIVGAVFFILSLVPAVWISFSKKSYFFPAFLLFYFAYGLFDYPLHRKDGILLLFFPLGFIYGRYIIENYNAVRQHSHRIAPDSSPKPV